MHNVRQGRCNSFVGNTVTMIITIHVDIYIAVTYALREEVVSHKGAILLLVYVVSCILPTTRRQQRHHGCQLICSRLSIVLLPREVFRSLDNMNLPHNAEFRDPCIIVWINREWNHAQFDRPFVGAAAWGPEGVRKFHIVWELEQEVLGFAIFICLNGIGADTACLVELVTKRVELDFSMLHAV